MVSVANPAIDLTTGEIIPNWEALPNWDLACETGRLAAQQLDEGRWILGDLAALIETRYNGHNIDDFARECNVSKKRIYEYRRVAGFYEKSARADYPNLTYSHFRLAMRLGDKAIDFLEECATNTWTIDEAGHTLSERMGNPAKATKLDEFTTTPGQAPAFLAETLNRLTDAEQVRIIVYEVTNGKA